METNNNELRRALKNRHIQLIALGGAIGTGLFYGSASSIGLAGPAIILAYCFGGVMVFFMMRALGEMAVEAPYSGSFSYYAYRFWGDMPGYISGWNYYLTIISASMVEIAAAGIYVQFFFPNFPVWVSALVFLAFFTGINLIGVKYFGEFEFWFALIKIAAIIGMIILGLIIVFNGTGVGSEPVGFHNLWTNGGFFANGFKGLFLAMVFVMFSFGGVEIIAVTAAETENPQVTIPKAVNSIIWRILLFYVGAIFIMVVIFPWNQVGLGESPFVQIFSAMGIKSAAVILNVVVLTAALSALNTNLYVSARMIHGLALQGNAPGIFKHVNKNGLPARAVLFSSGIALFGVVVSFFAPANAFDYLMSICMFAGVINWLMILYTQHKFRQGLNPEEVSKLRFRMPLYPYSLFAMLVCFAMIYIPMALLPYLRFAIYLGPFWIIILIVTYKLKKNRQTDKPQDA